MDVVLRWQEVSGELIGRAVAVVDTLRATTTMVTILAHGGTAVLPVAEMEQALALRARYPEALVGGERNNRRPKGFDAGNSPREYGSERVAGRRVILTTSNGTQAIARCVGAAWLAAAALVNASAAAQALTAVGDEALVVCAGGHGHPALEDVLAAGALVEQWPEEGWGDGARIAVAVWRQHRRDLLGALRTAAHGRELEAMHLEGDIEDAARVDDFAVVPVRGADGWFYAGP